MTRYINESDSLALGSHEETILTIQRWNGTGIFQLENQLGDRELYPVTEKDRVLNRIKDLDNIAANGVHYSIPYVSKKWKDEIDEQLITIEDCISDKDTPKSAIQRMISGHCHLNEQYWVSGISHILQLVQFYNTKPETALRMIEELWEARVNPPEKKGT